MTSPQLDTRTWLLWGIAAMLPLLIGRNPWISLEVLIIVLTVRAVAVPAAAGQRVSWFLRIALVMATISTVFNLLTVHSGDRTLVTLPASWPVIGGPLTLNALVYGIVGGLTLFTLVLVGLTTASMIRWVDLFHILPRRLAPIAVTGSVAWAFLPQTSVAWRNIQEAMAMRGYRFRRLRDFLPIVVPLLASGLDRSLAMAESLEARGFGAPVQSSMTPRANRRHLLAPVLLITALTGLVLTAYLIATGQPLAGLWTGGGVIAALAGYRQVSPPPLVQVTRYQILRLRQADFLAMGASLLAIGAILVTSWRDPIAMQLPVYPVLDWPRPVPLLMLALAPLLLPAFLIRPGEKP